ncbi:MAG: amidohydrolase family protein [Candidatus Hodarchaeota archaeon]
MSRLVLRNGNVFDSTTGEVIKNQTVVIKDGKIDWVGTDSSYEQESDDEALEVEGKFIIPGLMDLHVHLEYLHEFIYNMERALLRNKDAMFGYYALKNAQEHLKAGFTTIRDCGSLTLAPSSLRNLINKGIFPGPRLFVSQNIIAQWGNKEEFGPQDWINILGKREEVISGADGLIHAVRDRKRDGSDFIKTTTTGGVLHGQESKVEFALWNNEELKAMVTEAERLGMHVATHAHGSLGIHNAVQAGIHTIEHGSMITEETASLMTENGTFLVPTQSALSFFMNLTTEQRKMFPPEVVKKGEYLAGLTIKNHTMAYKKGVNISLGTDAPVASDHGNSYHELVLMNKHMGMTTSEALQAATINAARAIKMEAELGSIENGKFADLVVVSRNPLEDLALLEKTNLDYVIKDGRIMARQGKLII